MRGHHSIMLKISLIYRIIKEKIYTVFISFFYNFEHKQDPNFNTAFKNLYAQKCTFFDLQRDFKINSNKFEENHIISVIDRKLKNSNKYIFESWTKNKNNTYTDFLDFPFNSQKRKILKNLLQKPIKVYKKKIFLLPYYDNQPGSFMGDIFGSILFFLEFFKKRGLNEKILIRCPDIKWEKFFKKFYKKNVVFLPDNSFLKNNICFSNSQILPKFHPFQNYLIAKNILSLKIENNKFRNKKVFLTSERIEKISNIKDVITYLKKKNFIIVNPKNLSTLQLFKILNSAKVLISECASISHNLHLSRNKPYYLLLPNSFKDLNNLNKKWYRVTGMFSNFHSCLYKPIYCKNNNDIEYAWPLLDQIKVDLNKLKNL